MTRAMAVWNWIGKNEKQLTILFAMIAGLYVLYEYRLSVHASKVERAMAYVERGRSGEVQTDLHDLREFSWKLADSGDLKGVAPKDYSAEFARRLAGAGMVGRVDRVMEHYQDIATCVDAELCDAAVSCQLLFGEMQDFQENYRALLDAWRDRGGDTGPVQIAAFLKNQCVEERTKYCREVPRSVDCSGNDESDAVSMSGTRPFGTGEAIPN